MVTKAHALWKQNHPSYDKDWRQANPQKKEEYNIRRLNKAGQPYIWPRLTSDPEYFRWKHIFKKYGLTKEQWNTLFEAQNFCCACCHNTEPGTKLGWHTDHDPTKKRGDPGFIRGILCRSCNASVEKGTTADLDRLRKTVIYLETYICQ